MRTISNQDSALLNHPTGGYRTWIKAEVATTKTPVWGSETWIDLSDLNGYDWILGVEYGEDLNTPAWFATIRLLRQIGDNPLFSLSPFMTNSINNKDVTIVEPYNKVRISTAVVPMDATRNEADFKIVFVGRMDSYQMSGNEITIQCRDRTGELLDHICETEIGYGDDSPTGSTPQMEDVVQNLLDDHYNAHSVVGDQISLPRASALGSRTTDGSPWQLYSANGTAAQPWNSSDDSGWALRRFGNTKSTVWDWVQQIVAQRGWQLRVRYHEGSGIDDFVLVAEEPNRGASTADYTLDPNGGAIRIESVGLTNINVRNAVRIGYALNGGEATSTAIATDSNSYDKHGYRFMEVQESSASQIDTPTEAENFRDDLLSDTKEPTAQVRLACPYLWFAQLNDYVTLTADNFYFDSDQSLAVISRRNILQQGGPARTILGLEGKPKAKTRGHTEQQRTFRSTRRSPNFVQSSIGYGGLVGNSNFSDIGNE